MEEYKPHFLYFQCDVLLTGPWYKTGWDYRHSCKHKQLQSRIETSQAPQPAPELPSWMACESIEERKEAPFDGFPGKGMIWKAFFKIIFSELKSHKLWCSGPGDRSPMSAVEPWPGIHCCLAFPCLALVFPSGNVLLPDVSMPLRCNLHLLTSSAQQMLKG